LVIMIAWSIAAATHGLATGFCSLLLSRFLLGMGEGGGFPAATTAVAEWFPAHERSTALGFLNAGTAAGQLSAPHAIAAILDMARKIALGASAAVMPLIIFVTFAPTSLAIVLFSVAFFGQQSWSTLVMIVPTDLFDRRIVASVAGLVGFGGAMGGVVFNLAVG